MSDGPDLSRLSEDERRELAELLHRKDRATTENKLANFKPTAKQTEFIALTGEKRQALLMSGNQLGKSEIGAYILACHLTGRYPQNWEGRRFTKPIKAWAAGVTSKQTRDVIQSKLCGDANIPDAYGTGMIPKALLVSKQPSHGVQGAFDGINVRHASGGVSTLTFLSYEQGAEKWMGSTVDYIWLDEEPDEAIFIQTLARTAATDGSIVLTFTAENGMLRVLPRFWPYPDSDARGFVLMGYKDATFLTPEALGALLDRYPPSQRALRLEGIPMLGSGKVFPQDESYFTIPPFKIDPYARKIFGIDFGHSNDPTATVWLAHDREQDLAFVFDEFSAANVPIAEVAYAIKLRGVDVPGAWPADGGMKERGSGAGSGLTIKDLYKQEGVRMLGGPSKLADGTMKIEGGLALVENRLETGRLKIFSKCEGLLSEMRMYHRKDGKVAERQQDHFIDALRYAVVMIDHAKVARPPGSAQNSNRRPNMGGVPDDAWWLRGGSDGGRGEDPWWQK